MRMEISGTSGWNKTSDSYWYSWKDDGFPGTGKLLTTSSSTATDTDERGGVLRVELLLTSPLAYSSFLSLATLCLWLWSSLCLLGQAHYAVSLSVRKSYEFIPFQSKTYEKNLTSFRTLTHTQSFMQAYLPYKQKKHIFNPRSSSPTPKNRYVGFLDETDVEPTLLLQLVPPAGCFDNSEFSSAWAFFSFSTSFLNGSRTRPLYLWMFIEPWVSLLFLIGQLAYSGKRWKSSSFLFSFPCLLLRLCRHFHWKRWNWEQLRPAANFFWDRWWDLFILPFSFAADSPAPRSLYRAVNSSSASAFLSFLEGVLSSPFLCLVY